MSLKLLIQAYVWHIYARLVLTLRRFLSKAPKPTLTKRYPTRPNLVHRIFIPQSYVPGSKEKYPLYIDIHGGGFLLGHPFMGDSNCYYLANKFNMVVVSVQYSLTPRYPFPTAIHDVAEVSAAVIADSSLPIDTTKCAIGGTSAGGNLALAAPQIEPLKGKMRASVGVVPAVDFTLSLKEKLDSRWVKDREDFLTPMVPIFNWAHQRSGVDKENPLLSPRFAKREDLPPYIYLISAELDMLSDEQFCMARQLAGRTATYIQGRPDEEAFESEGGKVKWEMVKGHDHRFAYEHKDVAEGVYSRVGEWLTQCVFKHV